MKKYRKPYRIKKKKPIFRNRFFRLGILILILLFTIYYLLFLSQAFQIEKIIITGEEKVSTQDLKLFVEKKLEKTILFFKTKSIFLINSNEIKKDISKNFPQIAEVEIKRGFPDALNIVVIERLGLALWCYDEKCFLLDNEGVIFEETSPEINLIKLVNKQKPALPILGEKVIEKELLSQILEIEAKIKNDLKISIAEILFVSEERLDFKTSEGWEIYFNPQKDINWQLTKLRAVLEDGILLEKRKDLESIELRFGNFANPKYR